MPHQKITASRTTGSRQTKHHLPRASHVDQSQTGTKLTDTIRAIKRLTRDQSVNKLFINKNPQKIHPSPEASSSQRAARRRLHPPETRPRAPRRACEPSPPPTASPRRSRELTLPPAPGGDSPAPSPMRTPAMLRWAAALAVLLAVAAPAAGFYLPGVAPSDFAKVCWVPAIPFPTLVHLGVLV